MIEQRKNWRRQSTKPGEPGEKPPSSSRGARRRVRSRLSNTERAGEDTGDKSRTTNRRVDVSPETEPVGFHRNRKDKPEQAGRKSHSLSKRY